MKKTHTGFARRGARIAGVVLPLFGATCAHSVNTTLCRSADCTYNPAAGYRFHPESKPNRETLMIATFSGGGTRAAALAFGAMQALAELPSAEGSPALIDDLDVVSSVSGGSVSAAWYALHGRDGFVAPGNQKLVEFLYKDWTGTLVLHGLNPIALAGYLFTSRQRSDVLADFFAANLYGEAHYSDVAARYGSGARQGYVILNATDVGHETRFPFTQNNFDLICSDLSGMRLADAVSASADFPFVFSAVGVHDESPCPAQQTAAFSSDGPGQWIAKYNQFDTGATQRPDAEVILPSPLNLEGMREARLAATYLMPASSDKNLHLLDGGLADNLGIQSTLALSDDPKLEPGLANRLGATRTAGYNNVARLLYLVVNAQTVDPAGIDAGVYPPDEFTTALRVVDTALSATTLDVQSRLNTELKAATGLQPLIARGTSPQLYAKPPQPYGVSVDPEFITDRKCRKWFWSIPTSWQLPKETVDALIALGRTLVLKSPGLKAYYGDQVVPALAEPQDFSEACRVAWQAGG